MSEQAENFWHRPLSKGAARLLAAVLLGTVIVSEGWLGRRRLFVVHDSRYIIAFILFIALQVLLLSAIKFVAEKSKHLSDDPSFFYLQAWAGALSCLAMMAFGIFTDYTRSDLTSSSIFGSIFTGVILGGWNAASMKKPTPSSPA